MYIIYTTSPADINLKYLRTHLQTHWTRRPPNAEMCFRKLAHWAKSHLPALGGRPATNITEGS